MKKIVFIALFFSMSLTFAQFEGGDSGSSTFKQEAGDSNLELSLNPGSIFGSSSSSTLGFINNAIKFRKFSSKYKAFRMGVGVSYITDVDITQEADPEADELELKSTATAYSFSFMPGIEKHFEGSERFSPYVGGQFLLGYTHTSLNEEFQVDKKVYNSTFVNTPVGAGGAGEGGMSVGLGVLAGFDYYITKKIYLGVEFGIGMEYMKKADISYTNDYDHDLDFDVKNGYQFILSPGLSTSGLRLGWVF